MLTLTLEHVLLFHRLVIGHYGGLIGVRDLGRLESALATQYQEVFGEELYSTLTQKAAVLMRNIIADHPFIDGNKRTASLAALTLLELNGRAFIAQPGELENFAVSVATDHPDIDAISDWLGAHMGSVN